MRGRERALQRRRVGVPRAGNAVDRHRHRDALAHQPLQGALAPGRLAVEGKPEAIGGRHAARAQLELEQPPCHGRRREARLGDRQDALREIPEALLAVPPGDRDVAAHPEHVEHAPEVLAVVPAAGAPRHRRAVLELARAQRACAPQPVEDVAPEAGVLLQPLADVDAAHALAAREAPHRLAVHGEVRCRNDEGPVLEGLAPLVHDLVELGGAVLAETAPEHELLRARDDRRRIDLEAAEMAERLEHVSSAAARRAAASRLRAPGLLAREPQGSHRGRV